MTDIDPQADLEVHFAGEHMTVKVPLAGPVTGEWLQHYQELALAAEVRAQAETDHDRAWIVVTVPASSDQGKVGAALDAARALMAEADAAAQRPASVKAEAGVRDWWARSREGAPAAPRLGSRPQARSAVLGMS